MPEKKTDWIAIEGAYRLGVQSLRAIADRHGITEGAIRARAKKAAWVRNSPETKRAIVASAMAGVTQEVTQDVMRNLGIAAAQDIADLERGLRIHRQCLIALEVAAERVAEPREVKVIVEAASAAIASIRNIRGLDESATTKDNDNDDDARAESIAGRLESLIETETA
ncbi:MAG: hypothetical protein B7Z62_08855 [Deltaproteobacteria bacterium 37-65-8]|nr:MAG: hypothetical protein B7Z62_08855 [Deltaproteobacteria bacterium 37-65-8]